MVFSSSVFIFLFLPIALLGYYIICPRWRNYWLLFMSLVFFGWSQINYLWIIIFNILVNYVSGIILSGVNRKQIKRVIIICTVVISVGLLFYFKYFCFCISIVNAILSTDYSIPEIILPIGISFFTFQGMSYSIDVYRGNVNAQKNPFKVALYIMFFPQLIAGPIVRYSDIIEELDNRVVDVGDICSGIRRFIMGLGKKVLIANVLAASVDQIWSVGCTNNTVAIAWFGSVAYSLQIYYDFSGYSDMAIGLGKMFGFHFTENFDHPYCSMSITEFWRRWHISLSSWFRDYVYIPLGGNRKHVYLNLIIVFLLTGIWHGASWTFVLWGMWHGGFVLFERIMNNRGHKISKSIIRRISTLLIVNLGWVMFRAESVTLGLKYIESMIGIGIMGNPMFDLMWYLDRFTLVAMIFGIIFATELPKFVRSRLERLTSDSLYYSIANGASIGLLLASEIRIVSGSYNPFIYFQF